MIVRALNQETIAEDSSEMPTAGTNIISKLLFCSQSVEEVLVEVLLQEPEKSPCLGRVIACLKVNDDAAIVLVVPLLVLVSIAAILATVLAINVHVYTFLVLFLLTFFIVFHLG